MRSRDERVLASSGALAAVVVVWLAVFWWFWVEERSRNVVLIPLLMALSGMTVFPLIRRIWGDLIETGQARIYNFAMQTTGEKNIVCRKCGVRAEISTVEGSGFLSHYRLTCPSCRLAEEYKYLGDLPKI